MTLSLNKLLKFGSLLEGNDIKMVNITNKKKVEKEEERERDSGRKKGMAGKRGKVKN